MKSLSNFILESIDAEKSVDSILKKLVGKAVKLDELKKILAKDNWEYVSHEEDDHEWMFVGNFSNNADGDDEYLHIKYEQNGEKYKLVKYSIR